MKLICHSIVKSSVKLICYVNWLLFRNLLVKTSYPMTSSEKKNRRSQPITSLLYLIRLILFCRRKKELICSKKQFVFSETNIRNIRTSSIFTVTSPSNFRLLISKKLINFQPLLILTPPIIRDPRVCPFWNTYQWWRRMGALVSK